MMKPAIALWLLVAGVSYAAPLIDEPVAELRLSSGKILHDAVAKSFTHGSVFLKHRDGASSIKYEEFPAEFTEVLQSKRPAPSTAQAPVPPPKPAQKKATKAPVPHRPSMPLNRNSVGFSLVRIEGAFAVIELHNFSSRAQTVTPYDFTATTSHGRKILGEKWVGRDNNGRISVVFNDRQALPAEGPHTINLHFNLPSDASIVDVEWLHPQD